MNIKIRLEPKLDTSVMELVQKMKKQAEEDVTTEKTLDELLFGKEKTLDEFISEY